MSSIYTLHPPTTGKVILKTNFGNIDIELFCKECPKACRNFIQLCLEGYYDNKIFHRIINEFIIQCGGNETETTLGKEFSDEFHSRIKFRTRGMVACVNREKPNTNTNQFFITIIPCQWLDNKNTIFGKIVGDTFFNVKTISEVESSRDGVPLMEDESKPKILRAEVIINPFDDLIIRTDQKNLKNNEENQNKKVSNFNLEKKIKINNTNLLSFQDEDEEINKHLIKDSTNNNTEKTEELNRKNNQKMNKIKNAEINNNIFNEKNNEDLKNEQIPKQNNLLQSPKQENDIEKNLVHDNKIKKKTIFANKHKHMESNNHLDLNTTINLNESLISFNENILNSKNPHIKNNNNYDDDNEEDYSGLTALEKYRKKFMKTANVGTKQDKFLNKKQMNKETIQTLSKLRDKLKHEDNKSNLNNNSEQLNSSKKDNWMNSKLKFHIDSERAFSLQEVKEREEKFEIYKT